MVNAEVSASVADLAITGKLWVSCRLCTAKAEAHAPETKLKVGQHLIPVVSPPKCATCDGRAVILLTGGDDMSVDCDRCTDGYPIGQRITLTTSEQRRDEMYTGPYDKRFVKYVQVPRVEGTLRAVLPIRGYFGLEAGIVPYDNKLLVYNGPADTRGTDVSHLSGLCDWTPGGWAVLLTDLKGV